MNEDRPPRKLSWKQRLLKRSHSDYNPSDQSRRNVTDGNQTAPGRGRHKFADKIFCNMFKSSRSHSAEQPSYPPPMTPDAGARDHSSTHPNQDPSQNTDLVSDLNITQDTADSRNTKVKLPDPNQRIEDANKAFAGMKNIPGAVRTIPSVSNYAQSGFSAVDAITPCIEPLRIFNSVVKGIAEVHPYAKVALSIFTCASGMILAQKDRDNAVQGLLEKVSEVYKFMNEDGRLTEIQTMQAVYEKVARQTRECADFIVHYSETTNAWTRLAKNVFKETNAMIQSYNDILNALMQQIRDHAVRDTVITVHRIGLRQDYILHHSLQHVSSMLIF